MQLIKAQILLLLLHPTGALTSRTLSIYKTVLRHTVNTAELKKTVPKVADTLLAASAQVEYVKHTGLVRKRLQQRAGLRHSSLNLQSKISQ